MRLFSSYDDVCRTTLASVRGVFGRLDYLSGLRDETGRYQHWGVARVYGEEAAQQAFAEAHRAVFLQLLRMPLRDLLKDLPEAEAARVQGVRAFLENVKSRSEQVVPPDLGGGSVRHFSSVIDSLIALLKRSRARSASPPTA
ncbi:MAG: hypothetical protein JO187_13255 [Acidobacteria bacterium]|nr:hypothetical protein [Acidobacteriaceae bacterium]MBV9610522.1 hypothetical protein [Acidobacteriota bacterium]